jgi:hypothetical protein
MVASRRPQRRVRVVGCCLPIPVGMGLVSVAGLTLLGRRLRQARRTYQGETWILDSPEGV